MPASAPVGERESLVPACAELSRSSIANAAVSLSPGITWLYTSSVIDTGVPEHLAHYLRMHALRQEERHAGVSEVVEAYVGKPGPS